MHPTNGSQYLVNLQSSNLSSSVVNPGDIIFTSGTNHHNRSVHQPPIHRQHQNISVFSLVDPNIELPAISANEVEQVLSQLQSSSSESSAPPLSSKTGYWFSKDDSFTPPPTKRSFGGAITPSSVPHPSNQAPTNSQSLQTRSSSLVAALQLPPLGFGNSAMTLSSSSTSPPLHAALRKQLLAPSVAFNNLSSAAKQRQENLTVRLANRAKLNAAANRVPVVGESSAAGSECTTPTRSMVSQPAPMVVTSASSDLHIPQDPNERFRFVCPHPRCGRRYQARIGLTRHLVKYHGETVEAAEATAPPPGLKQQSKVEKSLQAPAAPSAVTTTMSVAAGNSVTAASSAVTPVQDEGVARLIRSPINGGCNGLAAQSISNGNCTATANSSVSHAPLKLCLSVRTVRVDHRSSQSLDRSKSHRRLPSPPPLSSTAVAPASSSSTSTPHPPLTGTFLGTAATATTTKAATLSSPGSRAALCSQTSPSLAFPERQHGAGGKVAIVSMQHSPPASSCDSLMLQQQHQQQKSPFQMSIYSNGVSELLSNSGGALTEPWCCSSSDRNASTMGGVRSSALSCCWPEDYEIEPDFLPCDPDNDDDDNDVLELGDCSSDLGFESCSCYYPPSTGGIGVGGRPTDSLPCLLHPPPPPHPRRHFHSPPPSLLNHSRHQVLLPSHTTEECSTCGCGCCRSSCSYWNTTTAADSDFSSSLGGMVGRGDWHSSEDGRGGFWTSPYPPRVPPSRQRKQHLASASSGGANSAASMKRRFSTNNGERKMRLRRHGGRRRTVSSSGDSGAGCVLAASVSASIIGGAEGGETKTSDELVTCPVHDCGLVCSGCQNLCEHLKECHLPDSQNKPVRLIFACPVKNCHTFCANEAAFEAHFDAHLESRITGRLGDYFRAQRPCPSNHNHHNANVGGGPPGPSVSSPPSSSSSSSATRRRHVKSSSSLVDLGMEVLYHDDDGSGGMGDHYGDGEGNGVTDDFCLPVSPIGGDGCSPAVDVLSARTSPAKFESPATPVALLDGENWGLLQALDLLPDEALHELLQEKNVGPPPLSPAGTAAAAVSTPSPQSCSAEHQQQTVEQMAVPMVVSSSSDSEAAVMEHQHVRRRSGGACCSFVKRQRNSLTCLDLPEGGERGSLVMTLARARSTQLRMKRDTPPPPPPPNTLPSASQLLFQNRAMNPHAVSTEDLFHVPSVAGISTWRHTFHPRPDSAIATTCGLDRSLWQYEGDTFGRHLSDTEMPPPSVSTATSIGGRISGGLASAQCTHQGPPQRRYVNRLKRRRHRGLPERHFTLDASRLHSLDFGATAVPTASSSSQQHQQQLQQPHNL